ncbi:MAG: FGGY family carbohydrate kinase [Planctomycetota bacterium]|jgi:glycerol kinase
MADTTLIAIDASTTSVSTLLFDRDLRLLHTASQEFEQLFPQPGWVEHRAADILAAVDATLREVLALPEAADVAAIGITNQRETVFALDPGADEAIVPGIVWQDRRTAERCRELVEQGHAPDIRAKTGLVVDPYFSATKAEWMLRHHDHLRERAEGGGVLFATVDTLVVQHLTEQEVLATDPTNASRTMLFDIERRQWDPELVALFGLQPDWLPEVRPSVGDFGKTSKYLFEREIPIRGVAGDQQAALVGQNGFAPGSFKNTYGTGCFSLVNTGQERFDTDRGLLTTLAVGSDGQPCFALEGSVFTAGAVIQWLRDQLGALPDAAHSEVLARSVPDTAGVVMVPAFAGLGAPHWDPDARGAIHGLTRGTELAHIVRAALEGIAFQNADLIDLLREVSGLPLRAVRVDGGGSANGLLMQLQADLADVCIERPTEIEATARGAAILAGLGAGLWGGADEVPTLEHERFEPAIDPDSRDRRRSAWLQAVERTRSDR